MVLPLVGEAPIVTAPASQRSFTLVVPGLLAPSPLPAVVKFTITVAVATAATLVSYHYLVRATAIGALLNGRRYPRGLTVRSAK